MLVSETDLEALEDRVYDFIRRCEYSDNGVSSMDEDIDACFRGLDRDSREALRFRLREHMDLKRDIPHFSREKLLEISSDANQRRFRESVRMATGDALPGEKWRISWEEASRQITCTILCDAIVDSGMTYQNTTDTKITRRKARI